jgi:hypothetical protein
VELHPDDTAWLNEFGGKYCHYVHMDSTYFKQVLRQQIMLTKSKEEVITHFRSTKFTIVSNVPCFPDHTYNSQSNYETIAKQLWAFLSFIQTPEAYRSMLFLLVLHPIGTSPYHTLSCDTQYIVGFVKHRYYLFQEEVKLTGEVILRTPNGTKITAEGAVKNLQWVDSYYSTISILHLNSNQQKPHTGPSALVASTSMLDSATKACSTHTLHADPTTFKILVVRPTHQLSKS